MAEWGCEHRLTVRSDHVLHVHSNYQERRHHSNFRKRPTPPPCWPPSIFASITHSHLWALQNLRECELIFFPIMTHSTKKGIILGDFSSWVSQTSTTDGLNLDIHIFVYVYKVHMCIYMLRGGMRSLTNCFFSLTYFFFRKRKAKDVNANHR